MLKSGLLTLALAPFFALAANASPLTCNALFNDRVQRSAPLPPSQISYRLTGPATAPVVILIHGLGGRIQTWNEVQEDLSKDYRVLAIDQRGHGKTPNIGEDYSTETLAKDLKGLMDALGIKHATLLGHSLGSRTAQKFNELFPDSVDALISEDMDAQVKQDSAPDKVAKHLKMGRFVARLRATYDSPDAIIEAVKPLYDGDFERSLRYAKRIVAHVDKETGKVYLNRPEVQMFYGFQGNVDDFGPMLKKSKTPMLFLRANPEKSPFFDDNGVAHIKANAGSNVHIEEISNAEHTMHRGESLGPYMILVRDFLKNHTVSRANAGRFYHPPGDEG